MVPTTPTAPNVPLAAAEASTTARRAVRWAVRIGFWAILFVIPLAAYL